MPRLKQVFLLFILFMIIATGRVWAACEVTSSTSYLSPNTATDVAVNIRNSGSNPISWIKIPIAYQSVVIINSQNTSEVGWTAGDTAYDYIYAGGTLNPGETFHVNINITMSDERSMGLIWQTAPNASGDGVEDCSALNLYSSYTAPPGAPAISNTNLSVGNSSATLSWTTDQTATGVVNYGTSEAYGSTVTTASGTSHTATLSSLSASTTYHYQIQVTGTGGTTTTTDATFTTSAADVTTVTTTTVTTTTTTATIITKILKDSTPPVATLQTDFSKVFTAAPTITGRASDAGTVNAGVAGLEYSLDGGKNWLPIEGVSGLGDRAVSFDFTPSRLDDGNYLVKIRVRDLTGNIGFSKTYTLIIDRLPPLVGGSLFALGPMILRPDDHGHFYSIAGMDLRVILSAVGGPISMELTYDSQKFDLSKNTESGLWSNNIRVNETGNFPFIIHAIDGAQNRTEKTLSTLVSLAPGRVFDVNQQPLTKAKVTVYTYEKNLNDFVLWDAEPYLQTNPQLTTSLGEYRLLLPAGKYFFEISADGKRKLRTEIFEIERATPITQNFVLSSGSFWNRWLAESTPFTSSITHTEYSRIQKLVGQTLPEFDLSQGDQAFSSSSILGKPTILTFLSSWEPQSSDQLLALDHFHAANPGVNTLAIAVQESVSRVNIFQKNGGYALPIVADPDGLLVQPLGLESLPTHLFLDRKGIIKEVITGYLNESTLLEKILK